MTTAIRFSGHYSSKASDGEAALERATASWVKLSRRRWPDQRFVFSTAILADGAANANSYWETYADMTELGLASFPFESFSISIPNVSGEGAHLPPPFSRLTFHCYPDGAWAEVELPDGSSEETYLDPFRVTIAKFLSASLVVLLATKNVEKKQRDKAKLLRMGIGRDDGGPRYTTTLSIGKVEYEDNGISVPGVEPRNVRPHLRRGHIRQQVCGAGRAERKKIFVPPCFVNGDPAFYPKREHYEIKMVKKEPAHAGT